MSGKDLPLRTEASRFSHYEFALVVGISDYSNTKYENLPACEQEAHALSKALVNPEGCALPENQVTFLSSAEATRANILEVMRELISLAGPTDILIFYFAGHGDSNEEGFTLCTGGGDTAVGVTASDLDTVFSAAKTRGIVVIVDCCGGAALAENAPAFFYRLEHSDFRLFISASRSEQSSWELPDGAGSLFTRNLLSILQGEQQIGQRGQIFFTDLFDHLHTSTQSDARSYLGDHRQQEPTFAGSFSKDPLLFLHKDLSLANIRVQTERITRAHLRRQVTMSVALLLLVVILSVGSYWAFLENHKHFKIEQDRVTLVHGYPGLSGFGLPATEWIYPFGPESLVLDNLPADRWLLTFTRGIDENEILGPALKPSYRAQLLHWQKRTDEARLLLRTAPYEFLSNIEQFQIVEQLVTSDDKLWLREEISDRTDEQIAWLVSALAKVDQQSAVTAMMSSDIKDLFAYQLNLLDVWQPPCTNSLQKWLDHFLSEESARYALPAIALVTVRTGCKFPAEVIFAVNDKHVESAMTALRLTNPYAASDIRSEIAKELQSDISGSFDVYDPGLPAKHRILANRLGLFARYLDGMPCIPEWLDRYRNDVFDPLDLDGRLNALVVTARNCNGSSIHLDYDESVSLRVSLNMTGQSSREVLYLPMTLNVQASLIPVLDALQEAEAVNLDSVLIEMLSMNFNEMVKLNLVERLRKLGVDGSSAHEYIVPNSFKLEVELIRWLATASPELSSKHLRERIIETGDLHFVSALAFVELAKNDRTAVLEKAGNFDTDIRVPILALIGTPEQVSLLFENPLPKVRQLTSTFAPLNSQWPEIRSLVEINYSRADPYFYNALERIQKGEELLEALNSTPQWARAWRKKWIEHSTIKDTGVALLFKKRSEDLLQ